MKPKIGINLNSRNKISEKVPKSNDYSLGETVSHELHTPLLIANCTDVMVNRMPKSIHSTIRYICCSTSILCTAALIFIPKKV